MSESLVETFTDFSCAFCKSKNLSRGQAIAQHKLLMLILTFSVDKKMGFSSEIDNFQFYALLKSGLRIYAKGTKKRNWQNLFQYNVNNSSQI